MIPNGERKRRIHPRSLANLARARQFRPGESGNPAGRPKGKKSIFEAMQSRLHGKVRELFEAEAAKPRKTPLERRLLDMELADAIAVLIIKQALKGQLPWLELLLDRTEGRLPNAPARRRPKSLR